MTTKNYIQSAAHTHVRKGGKWSRARLALAGGGMAGAMLLGGLFGSHLGQPSVQAHTRMFRATSPIVVTDTYSSSGSQMTMMPVSYNTSNDYINMARRAAINAGINPDAFVRQIRQESGFNPGAVSPSGAVGIAQFMPSTASSMGVNPRNPFSALNGGARMMANLAARFGGNYAKALAAYNAGEGAVRSAVARGGSNWLAYMPGETQHYVRSIGG